MQVIEAYERLGAGLKVAAALGIAEPTVYAVLARNGIERKGLARHYEASRKLRDTDAPAIIAAYDARIPIAEIEERFGVSSLTLRRFLDKHYPDRVREKAKAPKRKPLISAATQATILRLDDEGLAYAKIAEIAGCAEATVIRFIHIHHPDRKRARYRRRETSPAWKGGRVVHRGYIYLRADRDDPLAVAMASKEGYVLEHRLVMARRLGRPLRKNETVHHIDGNTQNNADANLQLRQGRHGKHVVLCCRDCGSSNIGPALIAEAA